MIKSLFLLSCLAMPLGAVGSLDLGPFIDFGVMLCQRISGDMPAYSNDIKNACKNFVKDIIRDKNDNRRLNKREIAIEICERAPSFPWNEKKSNVTANCLKKIIRNYAPDLE